MSQFGIDNFVYEFFNRKPGFYIEAGGSDPVDQNNTHFLSNHGWSGLIIEPNPEYNNQYLTRKKCIVENFALVSPAYPHSDISGNFFSRHVGGCTDGHPKTDTVPAITLEKLLVKHNIYEIDFFSLDVEGYEKEVLEGINFNLFLVKLMIIEWHYDDKYFLNDNLLDNFIYYGEIAGGHNSIYVNRRLNAN